MQFNPITIALIAVAAAYFIVEQLMRSTRLNKFALLLRDGRCDEALELLDKPSSKWLYPPFNREYMKLNAYLVKDDVEGASRQFDVLLTMRAAKNQRSEVVVRAFRFYMEHERYKDAQGGRDNAGTEGAGGGYLAARRAISSSSPAASLALLRHSATLALLWVFSYWVAMSSASRMRCCGPFAFSYCFSISGMWLESFSAKISHMRRDSSATGF